MPSQRRPGWWYPYLFILAFAVVVAVNLSLVLLAHDSFSGLSTDHPYERGLAYNQALEADRRQQGLGWTVDTTVQPSSDGSGIVIIQSYRDRAGRPVEGLGVGVRLTRPTARGYDREAGLTPVGPGRHSAVVALPLPGVWDIQTVARGEGGIAYQSFHRFVVP